MFCQKHLFKNILIYFLFRVRQKNQLVVFLAGVGGVYVHYASFYLWSYDTLEQIKGWVQCFTPVHPSQLSRSICCITQIKYIPYPLWIFYGNFMKNRERVMNLFIDAWLMKFSEVFNGATTFSITIFCITTLSIMGLFVTLSINGKQLKWHSAQCI